MSRLTYVVQPKAFSFTKVIAVNRYQASVLALALFAATGCSWWRGSPSSGDGPPALEPTTVGAEPAPDLEQVEDPAVLNTDELQAGLRWYLNKDDRPAAEKLTELLNRWGLQPVGDRLPQAEVDLDGDGTAELVTALTGAGANMTGRGALFVIYRQGGNWQVDRGEEVPGPALHGVADLTGDGRPEVIWSSTDAGAHTSFTTLFVSTWKPGQLEMLPGSLSMAGMELQVDGRDLVLTGGLINSVGAGPAQRSRTDRYRFDGEQFRLVDRRYAESPYGYHRLIDGIVAEEFGRTEEARQALREAAEADRPALGEGMVPPEWEDRFAAAVRTYARVRLALSLPPSDPLARQVLREVTGPYAGLAHAVLGTSGKEAACQAAAAWAESNPEFLEALNSPYGYAHPNWLPTNLCGPLPSDGT